MKNEWKIYGLSELFEFSSGLSKPRSDFGSGFGFLSFKDVFYNFFVPEKLTELVESTKHERETRSVKRGDVFLTRTSETQEELGMSCVALKDYQGATFNGFTKRLRPKPGVEIEPEYAGYYFRSPKFRNEISAYSSLSTRASLNNEMLGRLTMVLPPLETQKSIGATLKKFDDKIDLNRRMNRTLESMAQAIFKSWFVDFEPVNAKAAAKAAGASPAAIERAAMAAIAGRSIEEAIAQEGYFDDLASSNRESLAQTAALFPDAFQASELGEIPEGWATGKLSDVIKLNGGGTPRKSVPEYWNGDIPWFSVKDAPAEGDVYVLDTDLKITERGLSESSTKLLDAGTTIISARGTVGRLALAGQPMAMNQSCYGVVGAKGLTPLFTHLNLRRAVEMLKQNTHGAVFDTITRSTFQTVDQVMPSMPLVERFELLVEPFLSGIKLNGAQSRTLGQLRDTLLPKLLSGELRVPAAEAQAEEALA